MTDLYSFPLNRFPAALAAPLPNTLAPTLTAEQRAFSRWTMARRVMQAGRVYASGVGGGIGTGRGFMGVRCIETLDELLLAAANSVKE